MGKRYYCDYCDRSFADSPVNRKKHVNGVQHKRNRKLHYDSFKDAAEILAEESKKIPCKRFFQMGNCDFGPTCRFSHIDPKTLLQEAAGRKAFSNNSFGNKAEPKLEIWLTRWGKRKKSRQGKDKYKKRLDESEKSEEHILPPNMPPLSQLPPSLLPPPPGGHPILPKVEWG